jgi:hypothetical protein
LGLYIDDTLTWKTHIDNILPKLCSACFAMRSVKPYVSQQILIAIYYSYFHSLMSYGIIFWGQSANSIRIFRLQKRIIRIMMGCKSRDSCRKLFISLKILPFHSIPCMALQPLPGLGLPQSVPPLVPVFSSSPPSSYS